MTILIKLKPNSDNITANILTINNLLELKEFTSNIESNILKQHDSLTSKDMKICSIGTCFLFCLFYSPITILLRKFICIFFDRS
jgi:hypothetical protein